MFSLQCKGWLSGAVVMGVGVLFCLAQPVWAQEAAEPQEAEQSKSLTGETPESSPEMTRQKLIQRFQSLQEELSEIQQQAMEENKELEQEQQDLQAMIRQNMESNMADENVDVQRLQELQTKLQDKELEEAQKASLEQEYKKQINAYQRARAKTARDKDVQQEQEAFRDSMLSAMNEVDPKTDKIIQELQMIQHQMRYLKQSAPEGSN